MNNPEFIAYIEFTEGLMRGYTIASSSDGANYFASSSTVSMMRSSMLGAHFVAQP
jgi:hypothetical protein